MTFQESPLPFNGKSNKLISPNKLIEGGAAILHDLNRNHHKAILGIKFIKPLLINKLRLPNRS